MSKSSLLRVCSFESRRADAMRSLIERHGAVATVAPSMRELPLEDHHTVFEFAGELFAGRIDYTIFMTGVGTRVLLETLETRYSSAEIVKALNATTVLVRGPKPLPVLRDWSIGVDYRADEPNSWRELLPFFDDSAVDDSAADDSSASGTKSFSGQQVAVQEYGCANLEFYTELQSRHLIVFPVPIYRWALPEDIAPLQQAVQQTVDGQFDVLLFTSAQQVEHVLQVAESLDLRDSWLRAALKCFVGSIGPTNSEMLQRVGLRVDAEASPTKMGQLVRQSLTAAESR